ncbi:MULTISPECIES: ABC transporter permease [unclassified Paenibacillus]|uniref:ABC transporter permease n=1 Tax=Paenibacillus TaxID=44249 RepID=UPI00061F5E62|nr:MULTISPECIES: FtsX-like permease family protein [unclassified Paenibacillus]KKC47494.1 hypothetical protein VE23_10585 [Paenibacillus sp. D9]
MTFRSLALNNIRGSWRSYAAFFLSSVFSVMIFYLYASFLMHPDVASGHIVHANEVKPMMKFCEYLIVIFSFFFVLYSSSAFLKTRKKEFGLLSLFGTTRGQLRKMVVYESMAIAVLSIGAGLGLGILLSKLFLMALEVLLQSDVPIRFAIPGQAVLLTGGGFLLLFLAIALITAMTVGRQQIVELLGGARRPKKAPAASPWLSILAAASLVAGYGLACWMTPMNFLIFALPVIGLTTLGTYFLYTQLSVAVLNRLKRSKGIFYKRTNMLVISQMSYRIKDNARVLFVVTILSAVVMSAASTVYVFQKLQRDQILEHTPFTVGYVERGDGHPVMDPAQARKLLEDGGGRIAEQAELQGVVAKGLTSAAAGWKPEDSRKAMAVSASDYNLLAKRAGLDAVNPAEGEAVISFPYKEMKGSKTKPNETVSGQAGGASFELKLQKLVYGSVFSPVNDATYLLVVPDSTLQAWKDGAPSAERLRAYGFELSDWERALPAVQTFEKALAKEQKSFVQSYRVESYRDMKQSIGLTIFVGLFISVLFFVAAGSLLYFKQFTELQEDQSQFQALRKIGLTAGELRRTVAAQVGILYLAPCLLGIVHSVFAMFALGTLIGTPVWMYGLIIMGIYILLQGVYFLISCTAYTRSILKLPAS